MAWLRQHNLAWRIAAPGLLLIALGGPWYVDGVRIPAQQLCSAGYVRLEGDFCGEPVSIVVLTISFAAGYIQSAIKWVSGGPAPLDETFPTLVFSVPVLPFLSTILLVLRTGVKRRVFHIAVLGLAAAFALLFCTAISHRNFPGVLWGSWLYLVAATGAIIIEMTALVSDKKPGMSLFKHAGTLRPS